VDDLHVAGLDDGGSRVEQAVAAGMTVLRSASSRTRPGLRGFRAQELGQPGLMVATVAAAEVRGNRISLMAANRSSELLDSR
jgi:hypothetical protein